MKSLEERLNDRLEQVRPYTGLPGQHLGGFIPFALEAEPDSEVESLVALAHHLRTMPQIQVDADFARRLERRVLLRSAQTRLRRADRKLARFPLLRLHPALAATLGFCLLLLLLSTGLLAYAAQVSNPGNPLYALKRWEQHMQVSLSGDPSSQAALDLQFARDTLRTLPTLADPAHASAYEQALSDLDQHLQDAASAINALPVGTQHTQLAGELTGLRSDSIHVLRGLLSGLALPEDLTTTAQLARLGDITPRLTGALLTISLHPEGHATISFSGSDLQSGAQLLVDGKPTGARGVLQNGQLVFVLTNWDGARHPHRLGLLNPDGTAVQTTAITIHMENGNSNSNGNSNAPGTNKNGNGNGGNGNGNRPTTTPTPHPMPTPHH